jgi:uncharacterized membrane protein YkoI
MKRLLSLFAVLSIGFFAAVRADDEEKVPLDKLPKAVIESVKKKFPKSELVSASTEKEDGKTVYEVAVKENGKTTEVTLSAEGVILGLEKEIESKDLPKAVTDTLESKYAKATIKKIEEVIKVKDGKETLEYYEILLVTADKKTIEVEVTADGKIKMTEEKKSEKEEK